jgi:hypothetical protein
MRGRGGADGSHGRDLDRQSQHRQPAAYSEAMERVRRLQLGLVGAAIFLLVSCTSSSVPETVSATSILGPGTYHSPDGWTIDVPAGWHVLPFDAEDGYASAHGAQVSNVELPSPYIKLGFPMQTSAEVLPIDGIALVIAVEHDTNDPQEPPKSPPTPPLANVPWLAGSSIGGDQPVMDLLWFSGNGQTFIATSKIGAKATHADSQALDDIVASLHFESASS